MGAWSTFRTQVYDLVNNNKSSLNIQEVYNYPKLKFLGYPATNVTPSDSDNDYETTTENIRTYVFKVRNFYEMKNTGLQDAITALTDVADNVIDIFDQENEKSAANRVVGIDMPSRYTFLNIWASPSLWGLVEDEQLIFNEVSVRIRISYDAV